jgi:hypothetical protein
VTGWAEVFLGVIAAATLASAIVHVATLVGAAVLARRVMQLVDDVEQEMKPLFARLDAIGKDATRASALAVAQVERADRLLTTFASHVDQALDNVQDGLRVPGREARALMSGLRAALLSLRSVRGSRSRRAEDEEALFI